MSQLSSVLKRLMLKGNLTESELSRRTGIGQPVIHRISSGETDNPKIDTLLPIADYFAINLSELIGDHPLPEPHSREEAAKSESTYWHKVPLLDWRQIPIWLEHHQHIQPLRNIATQQTLSPNAYAVQLQDHSLSPTFPIYSIFVIDPKHKPASGDFCVIQVNGKQPVIYQCQTENKLFVPLNDNYEKFNANTAYTCLGTAVQVIFE